VPTKFGISPHITLSSLLSTLPPPRRFASVAEFNASSRWRKREARDRADKVGISPHTLHSSTLSPHFPRRFASVAEFNASSRWRSAGSRSCRQSLASPISHFSSLLNRLSPHFPRRLRLFRDSAPRHGQRKRGLAIVLDKFGISPRTLSVLPPALPTGLRLSPVQRLVAVAQAQAPDRADIKFGISFTFSLHEPDRRALDAHVP
jgi:hypothetical protein